MITAAITKIFPSSGKLKASFNLKLPDFATIYDCKIFENEKGMFYSLPKIQYKSGDGTTKYKDIISIDNEEIRNGIYNTVMEEYKKSLEFENERGQKLQEEYENSQELLPWDLDR